MTAEKVSTARRALVPTSALLAVVALHLAVQRLADVRRFTTAPDVATSTDAATWPAYVEHHTVQLVLGVVLLLALSRLRPGQWGLRRGDPATSRDLLLRGFFPILLIALLVGHAVVPLVEGAPPERFAEGVPAARDVLGILLFSAVLVGLSEEVLFRGVFHTLLARAWRGRLRLGALEVPVATLLSSAVFTLAHVGFRAGSIVADPRQLLLAFVLGVYYAIAYERTGSLLVPIVAHNAVDGGIVVVELAVTAALT